MFDDCIYFNLSSLSRQITKIWSDEFALLGLSPSHGYLLMAIAANPKASQQELRGIVELDASTVTRFVDALVAKNLVERSSPGKGCEMLLTAQGKQVVAKANRAGLALRERMLATFGEDEFNEFVGKLSQMKRTLKSDA